MQCGTVLLKSATGHHEKVLAHYRDLGVEYEEWDNGHARREGPRLQHRRLLAAQAPRRPALLGRRRRPSSTGAIFTPGSGYVNDPQLATHNLQRAAEAKGGEFLFRARWPRSAAPTAAWRA